MTFETETTVPGHDPETNAPTDCEECQEYREHDWRLGPFLSLDDTGLCFWHHPEEQKQEHKRIRGNERAEFIANYLEDPASFFASWFYLDSHPMFLAETAGENGEVFEHYRQGMRYVETSVVLADEEPGNYIMLFETGPIVEDDTGIRRQASSDYRLTVFADTFEEGIVQLAAKVAELYGHDYAERRL